MTGKTIRIYLVDGLPTGILTAEIMNWTGKVTVGPRSGLAELARRTEVEPTGVYLLVGPNPDSPTKDWVYVGFDNEFVVFKGSTARNQGIKATRSMKRVA